jgi:hypothetical protein
MVQPSIVSQNSMKRILVLGALGAGKSTMLNILNAQGLNQSRKEFVASNSLSGCTQEFSYDISPFDVVGQVQLLDSPGLADPNLLIDVWVRLYNNTVASQKW